MLALNSRPFLLCLSDGGVEGIYHHVKVSVEVTCPEIFMC